MEKRQEEAVRLIEERRVGTGTRRRPEHPVRKAAERAGIAESYWRQVVAGGVKVHGSWIESNPSPEVLIRMAAAVGAEARVRRVLGEKPARRTTGDPRDLAHAEFDQIAAQASEGSGIDLNLLRAWAEKHRDALGESDYAAYIGYIDRQEQMWALDRDKVIADLRPYAARAS